MGKTLFISLSPRWLVRLSMRTRLPEHICCDELVVCVSVSLSLSVSLSVCRCMPFCQFVSVCWFCCGLSILLSALPSLSFSLCNHVSWLSSVLPGDQYFPYLIEYQCATQNEDRTCERDFYFASHKLFVFYVFSLFLFLCLHQYHACILCQWCDCANQNGYLPMCWTILFWGTLFYYLKYFSMLYVII